MAATPAQAQLICAWRTDLSKFLLRVHAEVPVGRGLGANGNLIEIFAADDGTWTLLETQPNGISCLRAAGIAWSDVPPLIVRETQPDAENAGLRPDYAMPGYAMPDHATKGVSPRR